MSNQDTGTPSRRAFVLVGGAVAVLGVGAYALWRGALAGFGRVDNSGIKPVSYSFEDSNQCVLSASMTEGPYYVDEALVRRDVREDRQGRELLLRLKIVDGTTCEALAGAAVDIWHCDANGDYSAAPPLGSQERTGAGHLRPINAERFLRGRQVADAAGIVEFVTIYPGWYTGRTPHIHMKVFVGAREVATSQLFFPNELSAEVYRTTPYASRGQADTTNDEDGVLSRAGGANGAWPKMTRDGERLVGTLSVGVKRAA